MKVLVYFSPKQNKDHFEGARLRKTIKGSLELENITYTTIPEDNFDIAHLISPMDENQIAQIKERNIPIVVSALYSEDDPVSSYLDYKKKSDGIIEIFIQPKALRFLNKVDLVLVPTNGCKELLINQGVTTDIEVVSPGINFARFDFSREDEKDIFYRYAGIVKEKKIVSAIGEYANNLEGINCFLEAARLCPNVEFFFLGHDKDAIANKYLIKKISKNLPSNVHLKGIMSEDVYRSMIMDSDIFMLLGNNYPGIMSLYDAIAGKCQLIIRQHSIYPELLENGKDAYVSEYLNLLTQLVVDYLNGKIQPTVDYAYEKISQNDLQSFGEKLFRFYKKVIRKQKGE